jgi:hypothetical protein
LTTFFHRLLRTLAASALAYAAVVGVLYVSGSLPRHRAEAAWFVALSIAAVAISTGSARLDRAGRQELPTTREAALLAAYVCAAFVLYRRSLSVGFLSDDWVLLEQAQAGDFALGALFRPLPMLVWWASSFAGLAHAASLHALNIAVHGLNSYLVYRLTRATGISLIWSLIAGLFFLTSPASVEPVVWISALFDLACTAGLLVFAIGIAENSAITGSVGLVLALLSKEVAVVAPAIGVLLKGALSRRWFPASIGVAGPAAFVAVRMWLLPPPDSFFVEPSRYVIKELVSRVFGGILLPWTARELEQDGLRHVLAWFPWLTVVALVIAALWSRPWDRRLVYLAGASAAMVVLSVLPVYSYLFVGPDLENSRYLYFGTAAMAVLIATVAAALTDALPSRLFIGAFTVTLLVAVTGVQSHQRSWIAAGAMRDRVLASARNTLGATSCESIEVTNLPDLEQGAYVFRNGFEQALRAHRIRTPSILPAAGCSYRWTPAGFVLINRTSR